MIYSKQSKQTNLSACSKMWWWRRSITQLRKMKDSLTITPNKTDGSTAVVKNILQGDKMLKLDHNITVEVNFPLTHRLVIQKVKQKSVTRCWKKTTPSRLQELSPSLEGTTLQPSWRSQWQRERHSNQHPVEQERTATRFVHPRIPVVLPVPEVLAHIRQLSGWGY